MCKRNCVITALIKPVHVYIRPGRAITWILCKIPCQAICMRGIKSPLYMELHPDILDYLSLAMQREVIAAGDADGDGQAEAKSPSKKRRRRFQPPRSPKRKARKHNALPNVQDVQDSQELEE